MESGPWALESSFEEWKPRGAGAGHVGAWALESSFEEWKQCRAVDEGAEWQLLNLPLRNGNDKLEGELLAYPHLLNLPLRNGNNSTRK